MGFMVNGARDVAGQIAERQMRLLNALRTEVHGNGHLDSTTGCRFLTVTRDEGSLGNEIVKEVARRLDWKVYDKEIVNFIAENSHVREDLVRRLDLKSRSLVEDAILRLLSMPGIKAFGNEEYHAALLHTLAYVATQGAAIILGRGGNVALRDEVHGLHIRITASPQIRIQRLTQEWLISPEEARRRMQSQDTERRNFVRHHFRQELDDPRFYDLMFNTDRLTTAQVSASILQAVQGAASDGYLRNASR